LRGRKTEGEIERLQAAIALTDKIIDRIGGVLKPGMGGLQMANFVLGEYEKERVVPTWDIKSCPTVTVGTDSPVGHLSPSDEYVAKAGDLIHMDQGIILNDYISDIQRVWYLQPKDETEIPAAIQHAFDSVRAAIMAAAALLKPGVQGYVVDDAARQTIIKAGYPEYKHATGHQIGRTVHDGSVLLGPRWERYGKTPYGIVEAGNCFTLELGAPVTGHGFIGLEEDVLVTDQGVEWLGKVQDKLWVVKV
jgi:Xaa-Pro aminopeptidase